MRVFIKAFNERKEREFKEKEIAAWMQGAYIQYAVASVLDSKTRYPETANLFSEAGPSRVQHQSARFMDYATAFNRKFKNKQ